MDGKMNKADGSDGTGSHIWLRYATQFTMNGRSVTVEMGIPVPLGASAETRERLIREAEEGMEQLSNHIEGRIGQMVQRIQQAPTTKQPTTRPVNTPTATPTSVTPTPAPKPPIPIQPAQPKQSAQSTQPIQLVSARDTAKATSQDNEAPTPAASPTRMNVGASMPTMPTSGDTAGNLSLPQFIQIIRESLNLTPKQAMDLLKVKSLSGLNYRTALEDLQAVTPSDVSNEPEPPLKLREETPSRGGERSATNTGTRGTASQPPAQAPASNIVPISKKVPYEEIPHAVIRETPPTYPPAFDEELDDVDIEFADETDGYPQLTQHEREIAEEVLKRLQDAQGSSVASPTRFNAMNNVIGGQISNEQLGQLIQGVWNVNSTKKLKNDQVEALVYWGKSDNFIEEVELVLALLEEGDYARSDR
ncbi:MAG: hypothetical protein ABI406_13875 [Ktedonobacteraceae bacterium]